MRLIWFYFYNILVFPLIYTLFKAGSLFNDKIKRGMRDRKNIYIKVGDVLKRDHSDSKILWFHSASLGEFEQAKPIIEELKRKTDVLILVTFFSPSGYENSLKYAYADCISYIPLDSLKHVRKFIDLVNPDILVFMRYDIWPNLIWEAFRRKIPVFLVDATMKRRTARNWFVVKDFFRSVYQSLTRILTVSERDIQNFRVFDILESRLTAVGDTRFDRVYQRSIKAREKKLFREDFFKDKKVFVCGSSWEQDEEVLFPAFIKACKYDKNLLMILVPHEPTITRLERIENELSGKISSIRFSYLNNYKDEKVILIDSIGILSTLYFYADVAYVGGGFKHGIHNVLEAAVYGIPVLCGPRNSNSQETMALVKKGGGMVLNNKKEAYKLLRGLFKSEDLRNNKGEISSNFVMDNVGATKKIVDEISNFIGLT